MGDSANHTNPTRGRGVSLGLAHAQALARTIDQAIDDPSAHALAFDRWTRDNIEVWFESQQLFDAAICRRMKASIERAEPPPPDPRLLPHLALVGMMESDQQVALAFFRMFSLLTTPPEVFGQPEIAAKIEAFLATPAGPPPFSAPSRAEFERLVQGEVEPA